MLKENPEEPLTWIHYQKFMRRTASLKAARDVFTRYLKETDPSKYSLAHGLSFSYNNRFFQGFV